MGRGLPPAVGLITEPTHAGETLANRRADVVLLARCFRTRPEFWLSLQNAYDLSRAEAEFGAEIDARVRPIGA